MATSFAASAAGIIAAFVFWIPKLIAGIIAFLIGWLISWLIARAIYSVLRGIGLNRLTARSETFLRKVSDDPSRTISRIVYWILLIVTIAIAIGYLGIPGLTELVNRMFAFIPNLAGGIVILIVALAFASAFGSLILRWMGDTATGKILASVGPTLIMLIATFAILEQLKVAPIIVATTYIALIGSLALGAAISFGLGSQEVARRLVDQIYQKSGDAVARAKEDIGKGRNRARRDVERAKGEFTER